MNRIILLFLFFVAFIACKSTSVDSEATFTGRWVEATGRGDTLIFNANSASFLEIKRGYALQNGVRLPRGGSGLWQYKLLKDYKMEVNNLLSSSSATTVSHVELKDKILYISNFYEFENKSLELRAFNRQ